jgi:hypothetical protein
VIDSDVIGELTLERCNLGAEYVATASQDFSDGAIDFMLVREISGARVGLRDLIGQCAAHRYLARLSR